LTSVVPGQARPWQFLGRLLPKRRLAPTRSIR
jgi:hypothetical protein